jgi:hypothetical protein
MFEMMPNRLRTLNPSPGDDFQPRPLMMRAFVLLSSSTLVGCNAGRPLPESRHPIQLYAVPLQYDDNVQSSFAVSEEQWSEIASYFEGVSDGPSERAAIARTIARLERLAGEQTPIHRDGRKNYGAGPGETDCLDESTNTTTFLRLLRERDMLKHNRVMEKALRSPLQLDIHWTAVVQDLETKEKWVIDSWYNANGIEPIIQPLDDWLKKKPVPGYYAEPEQQTSATGQ